MKQAFLFLYLFIVPLLAIGQINEENSYNYFIDTQAKKLLLKKCKIKQENKDSIYCKFDNHPLLIYKDAILPYYRVKAFNDNLRNFFNNDICNFIERELFLHLFLNDVNKKDRIKITNIRLINPLTNKVPYRKDILNIIDKINSIKINTKNTKASVSLIGSTSSLELIFPMKFDVVYGKNKYQLQQDLVSEFQKNTERKIHFYNPESSLLTESEGVSYYKGDTLFIKKINNNLYFDNNNEILFNKKYPKKSLANLMLSDIANSKKIKVNISFINYNTKDSLIVNLKNLLGFFNKDYKKFFGIEQYSGQEIKAVLFIVNKRLNFTHMLYITANDDELFSDYPELSIKMHSYIPLSNMSNFIKSN